MVGARIKIMWEDQLVDPPNEYKVKCKKLLLLEMWLIIAVTMA